MKNKTCGECKHYIAEMFHCQKNDVMAESFNTCEDFEPEVTTNGDVIRQMSNEELATFLKSRTSVYPDFCTQNIAANKCNCCLECWLEYLNAPAESEGKDE